MIMQPEDLNEQHAAAAFDHQSANFDEQYTSDAIIAYKRDSVRQHMLRFLKPQSNILELNAGTGDDAVFFAKRGHAVHATDISAGMQKQLQEKIILQRLQSSVSNEICSFTKLEELKNKGPYDHIFSNFAGLNCTGNLGRVLDSLDALLKKDGMITLVMLPKFCLWETLLVFKGKFKTATRRLFSRNGRKAKIDNKYFTCWYYSPEFIIKRLKKNYTLKSLEGLCTIVPPSYLEHFGEKYSKIFSFLRSKEDKLKNKWPWKYIGDYYIISLRKNN